MFSYPDPYLNISIPTLTEVYVTLIRGTSLKNMIEDIEHSRLGRKSMGLVDGGDFGEKTYTKSKTEEYQRVISTKVDQRPLKTI